MFNIYVTKFQAFAILPIFRFFSKRSPARKAQRPFSKKNFDLLSTKVSHGYREWETTTGIDDFT